MERSFQVTCQKGLHGPKRVTSFVKAKSVDEALERATNGLISLDPYERVIKVEAMDGLEDPWEES